MQQKKSNLISSCKVYKRGCFHIKPSLFFKFLFILQFIFLAHKTPSDFTKLDIDSLNFELTRSISPSGRFKVLKDICNYWRFVDYDSAFVYCNLNAEAAKNTGLLKEYLELKVVVGNVHQNKGEYADAIKKYIYALEGFYEINDSAKIAMCYNHVGMSYFLDKKLDNALEYYSKAISIGKKVSAPSAFADYSNNIAVVYRRMGDLEKALFHHDNSYYYYKKANNLDGIANVLNNKAIIFYGENNYAKALEYFKESAEARRKAGNMQGFGNTIFNIGFVNEQTGQFEEAYYYFQKSLNIAKDLGSLPLKRLSYLKLSETKENLSKYKKALVYYDKFVTVSDSIYNIEQTNKLQEIKTAHEARQEELIVDLLKKKSEAGSLELSRVRIIFFSVLGLVIIFFTFFILILLKVKSRARVYNKINEQNNKILNYREDLLYKKEELTALNKKLKEKKSEANRQSETLKLKSNELLDSIETTNKQKNEIESSLRYAAKLQSTLSQNSNIITEENDIHVFPQNQDYLTDSSYWLYKNNGQLYIAVFDAPAQSISGAFWCVMVNTLLNKIVIEQNISSPGEICSEITGSISETLKTAAAKSSFSFDNCGIFISKTDSCSKEIEYYCKKLPVYISDNDGEIKELPSNSNEGFLSSRANISKGDRIWVFNQSAKSILIKSTSKETDVINKYLKDNKRSNKEIITDLLNSTDISDKEKNKLLVIGTTVK